MIMKYYITGKRRGLGKALSEIYDIINQPHKVKEITICP
jgi:hypothetical protein